MAAVPLERNIVHAIRIALGNQPDLDLERRSVGMLKDAAGKAVRYGTPGEADLQGVLAMSVHLSPDAPPVTIGRLFCLEIKRPGEKSRPEQVQWANRKRMRGAFVAEVHSVDEAFAALDRARRGERE